jgi:hypothetical protein
MVAFFTARTVGQDREGLQAIRAGAAWVYTNAPATFLQETAAHAERIAGVLATQPLCQFSFLATLCRKDRVLAAYEQQYLVYIANLACTMGLAEKFACRTQDGVPYTCYVSAGQAPRIAETIRGLTDRLRRTHTLRFKAVAADLYGGVKGSYYWAKSLLEHLVYLRLASHADQWSVSS